MRIGNGIVATVLRSPAHRLLSGSTDLIRYTGRRSGRVIVTPTQYVSCGDDVVILVGRAASKTWWRNFTEVCDVDVLVRGTWRAMTGQVVLGAKEPETAAPLLDSYLARFPRAAKTLGGQTRAQQLDNAIVVRCRPREHRALSSRCGCL
jgi:Domain of unknown function (DUF385).